jgi:molybdate transport system ATP-binding protein
MIYLKNISVTKAGKKLFENFSFAIKPGEHWVIQGRNGAGKTLLLQLIAGAVHPQSGEVRHTFIAGHDWDSLYRQRQETIHFIPTHWLQVFLTGFEGLFYQQRYYNIDDTALPTVRDVFGAEASNLDKFVFSSNFDISRLLDVHITRLSNGQLKKVIILRELARNIPKVLILDYPFDGLDPDSRKDLIRFIDDISTKFDIQIILADHGDNLPSVINRKLVLENFALVYAGPMTARVSPPELPGFPYQTESAVGIPVVEMRDLTIAYGGKKIIAGVNWRINKGERWALTGKNGSGKTTLFSLIYADHPMAYSQQVFLFGKRRGSGESIWDIKKRISYLGPEHIHFLNPKSIAYSGREYISRQPHSELSRLNDLVSFFDAGEYIDLPLRILSSGQLQMVLLINMFLDRKELILLDEPFQFLDPINHDRVTDFLNYYLDKDVTLVLITHDEKDVTRWTQLRKVL